MYSLYWRYAPLTSVLLGVELVSGLEQRQQHLDMEGECTHTIFTPARDLCRHFASFHPLGPVSPWPHVECKPAAFAVDPASY